MTERTLGSPLSMHDPRQVGPWAVHSRLGAGGMGVVFQATAPEHGTAALKVIRPGLLDAPATRDRFRREVAILKSVRDAHICQYLDADIESEPAWLALEYISGPTLREEVEDRGPLGEERWWDLARGMAQALAILDVHRITHRDLKPGNVILNERGPVLIDFGIAHPEDATSLTATGLVTGSPAWLSPEQATLDPVGPASDIFALGSMLSYAATGRPPFGEGASVAVLMSIASREADLVGVDPNRTALLLRMLSKDPGRRPTARQVLDRLRGHGTSPQAGLLDAAPASAPGLPPTRPTVVADAPTAVQGTDPIDEATVLAPLLPMAAAGGPSDTQADPGVPGLLEQPASDATRVAPPVRTSPAPPPVRPRTAPRRAAASAAPRGRSG
ncbi:MAG: protein kinase, partial [Candidatus Nanopelagicales bacterium]